MQTTEHALETIIEDRLLDPAVSGYRKRLPTDYDRELCLDGDLVLEFIYATQPEAWAACRTRLEPPDQAMKRYVAWIRSLKADPVFVAYPAGFDFSFVNWYLIRFIGESPFRHSALDIKSFAMAVLQTDYLKSTKRHMPKQWLDELPHTHVALDDAIEQGALFCNMLRENRLRKQ